MEDNALVDLVKRAKKGDEQAITELMDRFRPLVRACCRGLSASDGQDLEQELYIQLIRLIQRYDPRDSIPFDRFVREQ